MRKRLTAINLIPVNGIYHPTDPLTAEQLAIVRKYTDRNVSADVITADEKAAFAAAIKRVEKALSERGV